MDIAEKLRGLELETVCPWNRELNFNELESLEKGRRRSRENQEESDRDTPQETRRGRQPSLPDASLYEPFVK